MLPQVVPVLWQYKNKHVYGQQISTCGATKENPETLKNTDKEPYGKHSIAEFFICHTLAGAHNIID